MAFKLMMSAQGKWRNLDGQNRLPEIIEGVEFRDGLRHFQTAASCSITTFCAYLLAVDAASLSVTFPDGQTLLNYNIDTIDMSGMTQSTAFMTMSYQDLGSAITVHVDGAANAATVDKGALGTDTLVDIQNALLAGYNLRRVRHYRHLAG